MNLGELIEALGEHDQGARVTIDKTPVMLVIDGLDSYRGYYEDLAVNVKAARRSDVTVKSFIESLRETIGQCITGYKGGSYLVTPNTRVWISNYGECSGARVTGVKADEYGYVYITWESDDD